MKQLRLGQGISLPVDVAGEAIAILAKRGAGKTNTATVLVEEMVAAGVQVVILDPVGAWWGIRSSADGKTGGLSVPIIGGAHGDLERLEPTAGALIADVAVDTGQSLLIDLSDFSSKETVRRFVTDFAERLYRRKAHEKSLLHLVLEEADEFAPQQGRADTARMRGAIEQLVRRGRSRGIGVTMITQRSSVLNKDVLTQADVLIAMRTGGPHDLKALGAWVESRADRHDEVLDSLPGLATGEAWFWNPERDLLQRAKVRRRHTFDSSATPKAGERRAEPKTVAAIDLEQLGEKIKATADKAKASDPRELQKRIRELETEAENERRARQVAEQRANTIVEPEIRVETVEVPVVSDGQLEFLRAIARELQEAASRASQTADEILAAVTSQVPGRYPPGTERPRAQIRPLREAAPAGRKTPERAAQRAPAAAATAVVDFRPSVPQQRILDELARMAAIGITAAAKTQLALFAKASPKSSAFTNNLGTLRSNGLIDYPAPGTVALTHDGVAQANPSDAPLSSSELHAFVFDLVGGAKTRLLEVLIDEYPNAIPKVELAERAGASPTSSAFTNNLGSLRSLGLLDYPQQGWVAAEPILFLEDE